MANTTEEWDQGFPFNGITTSNTQGTMISWDQGFPMNYFQASAGTVVQISVLSLLGVG